MLSEFSLIKFGTELCAEIAIKKRKTYKIWGEKALLNAQILEKKITDMHQCVCVFKKLGERDAIAH